MTLLRGKTEKETGKQAPALYLDLLKVLGAVSIVALHTLSLTISRAAYLPDSWWSTKHILHQFFYVAVPVFVLATGAGFFSAGKERTYRNMWPYILKMMLCILVFGTAYSLGNQLLKTGGMDPMTVLWDVLSDRSASHLWYLYRLLGIYLCMPLFSVFFRNAARKVSLIFTLILLLFTCVLPYFVGFVEAWTWVDVLPVTSVWVFYVFAGALLENADNETLLKSGWVWIPAAVIGGFWIYSEAALGISPSENHPGVVLLALSIFAGGKILCRHRTSGMILRQAAACSLGVYIIHPVFLHVILKLLPDNPWYMNRFTVLPLMMAAGYGAALLTTYLLRLIPGVKKYLL